MINRNYYQSKGTSTNDAKDTGNKSSRQQFQPIDHNVTKRKRIQDILKTTLQTDLPIQLLKIKVKVKLKV